MDATDETAEYPIGYYPGESRNNNIISYLERHALDFPDRPALRWVDSAAAQWAGETAAPLSYQEVTFGALTRGIAAAAAGLAKLGIKPGDRVIIFLPMGVAMYTAMFAVMRLGAIAVFLDSWARRAQLGASAACVEPVAMISFQAAFTLIDSVPEFAHLRYKVLVGPGEGAGYAARFEQLLDTTESVPLAPVASESTALITFTTGSSGVPKGANRTHRFLSAQHLALSQIIPYRTDDTDLPAFPIFSLNNLAAGVTTVIPAIDLAAPSEHDGALLTAQIRQQDITCTTLSPSMLAAVSGYCRAQGIALTSLRRVVTGGAPISKDNVQAFMAIAPAATVLVFYGSTEVEPMAHIDGTEMLAQSVSADPEQLEYGVNVGHVDTHLRSKFINIIHGPIELAKTPWPELEVPTGTVGEFIVSGEHVCRDYYHNEEAFRRTKIVDDDGAVWHRTGDLGRLDAQGYLWIVGRINNVIRRGGAYLFPVQAEILLKRLPGVTQAALLGLPDDVLEERAAAIVTLAATPAAPGALAREARRILAKNGIPLDALYLVDAIPMDPRHHSKVEYPVLRAAILATPPEDWLRDR